MLCNHKRGKGVSKRLKHDYWGGGWPCDDISKYVFFTKLNSFQISPVVLLKLLHVFYLRFFINLY